MHIPDGYLSPVTCATFLAVDVPIWAAAAKRVHRTVKSRNVPLLAVGAAYCFLIMMFNVPVPDGTTAHAVGAVLVAVLLGPEAAIVAVTSALVVQALFFGDGGVLALSVNAFNMGVAMPLVGYSAYRLLARGRAVTSPRRALAAGVGGYLGINTAALLAALELGLQPVLFHTANGTPLYAPFHLYQTLPPIMMAHLTVAGLVEFGMTFGIVAYLQRANLPLLRINPRNLGPADAGSLAPARRSAGWRLGVGAVLAMAVLTPLGLLAHGGAFGEAAPGALDLRKYHLSAVPSGLARYAGTWHHVILNGSGFGGGGHPVIGYLVSAFVGILLLGGALLAAFALRRRGVQGDDEADPAPARAAAPAGGHAAPAWLLEADTGLAPCSHAGRRRRGSFVDKTIGGAAGVMRQAIFSEDVAAEDGVLQHLEPRVKLVSLLLALVAAALIRHLPVLLAMYLGTLALAGVSKVSLSFFVKRVWLFIPIFTGIVVLPATLSIVTPGRVVLSLGHWWFGQQIGVTAQGLGAGGLIVTRVAVSISLVVLLTLTTPWNRLLAALRALLVPRIFVAVLGMCYRYIFYLLNAVTDMYTARKARSVGGAVRARGPQGSRSGRSFVAATAGALFGKANALSEEVHMAMTARGYTGNVSTISQRRVRAMDLALGVAVVAAAALAVGGDRILGR